MIVASAIFGGARRLLGQAVSGEAGEASGEQPAVPATAATEQPFGGLLGKEHEPRILIIDDDLSVRRVCTFALRGMGWRPEGEGSARVALTRISAGEKFDVVVLDYAMPEMDGLEFLHALARIPSEIVRPQILMASAHADGAVAREAMSLGVWDFLAKPLMPDDIRRRVRRLLNRKVIAERGDKIAAALRHATQREWSAALAVLADVTTSPAPLLRGLLHEIQGNPETARLDYARAHWNANWAQGDSDMWTSLSARLDIGD